ncbi:MAG: DUF1018 domain-containing protein [Desulfobacteraceae bacterium]|nr:DUF1018 domain-containing protein [Desulfobacteraceae bacterium]
MNKKNYESSKKQRQLIGMACAYFSINKEDKKAILLDRFGKNSTTDLNYAHAEELIDDFVSKGFTIKSTKRKYMKRKSIVGKKPGKLVALVSPAELSKIDAVAGLISWKVENGFQKWMKKRFKIVKVKTAYNAFVVIEGLKGMFENQMKKQYGPDWWQQPHEDVEIRYYIAQHFPA